MGYCSDQARSEAAATAVTLEGGISVGMRCRECSHEWRYDVLITTDRNRDSGTLKTATAK